MGFRAQGLRFRGGLITSGSQGMKTEKTMQSIEWLEL